MNWAIVIYVYVSSYLPSMVCLTYPYRSPFQIVAFVYWYVSGYKNFRGPCPNLGRDDKDHVEPITDHVREEISSASSHEKTQ
jgi:hypothetical protein